MIVTEAKNGFNSEPASVPFSTIGASVIGLPPCKAEDKICNFEKLEPSYIGQIIAGNHGVIH